MNNEKIYIHSYPGKEESGSRFYIHARNISSAVLFLIENGTIVQKQIDISSSPSQYHLVNFDISENVLEQARKKIMDSSVNYINDKYVNFHVCGDMENLPFRDNLFDLVWSSSFGMISVRLACARRASFAFI